MPNLRSFLLEHSCKDDPLIASLNLIKSPIQSHSLSFTKIKDLDLDKKIEGLAYMLTLNSRYGGLGYKRGILCLQELAKSLQQNKVGLFVKSFLYPRPPYLEFRVSIYASCVFAFAQICAKFDLLKVSALLFLLSFLFHHAAAPQYQDLI